MAAHDGTDWSLSTDRLFDRISGNRWVPLAANLIALALLISGLAQWTWRLLTPAAPPVASMPRAPEPAPLDLPTLLAANLFGQAQTAGAVSPQQLPLSSLNLVLTGVMAHGKSSFALVSVNGAPEGPYFIGQEITAGANLEAVHSDRIIIRRGSALESVVLKDTEATLPPGSIVTAQPPGPADNTIQSLGGGRYNIDRQALTQSLTAETLSQAAVAPGAGGLVVREIQPGGMFDKLGLRTGDVVRSVNGQPVNGLDDVAKAYAQFAAAPQSGRVMVEVMRGGKTEVLQYQMH